MNLERASRAWVGLLLAPEGSITSASVREELVAIAEVVNSRWREFRRYYQNKRAGSDFWGTNKRGDTRFYHNRYLGSDALLEDIKSFVQVDAGDGDTPGKFRIDIEEADD